VNVDLLTVDYEISPFAFVIDSVRIRNKGNLTVNVSEAIAKGWQFLVEVLVVVTLGDVDFAHRLYYSGNSGNVKHYMALPRTSRSNLSSSY